MVYLVKEGSCKTKICKIYGQQRSEVIYMSLEPLQLREGVRSGRIGLCINRLAIYVDINDFVELQKQV